MSCLYHTVSQAPKLSTLWQSRYDSSRTSSSSLCDGHGLCSSVCVCVFPVHFPIYYLRSSFFSLSLLVVTQIRGHIAGSSPPIPTAVRALRFYRERISALFSLVDSRRTVLTHAIGALSSWSFFFACKFKSHHGGIRAHGPTLVLPIDHRGDRFDPEKRNECTISREATLRRGQGDTKPTLPRDVKKQPRSHGYKNSNSSTAPVRQHQLQTLAFVTATEPWRSYVWAVFTRRHLQAGSSIKSRYPSESSPMSTPLWRDRPWNFARL